MALELVSIATETELLDGLYYEPEGGARNGAVLIMHGNCSNFYTGVPRALPPLLTELGYACLSFNRRGHDIMTNLTRKAGGGAFQRIDEMVADNRHAEEWLAQRGHRNPIVIGHSNGGMLAVKHCAGHPGVRGLVLFSAHMGGKGLFSAISKAGLMAADRLDEFSARARDLVAAGKGRELMLVPGWWWVISADTFVDYLDTCPDILELAPQMRCPVLFLRGDKEPQHIYPGHFYGGREAAAMRIAARWFASHGLDRPA